MEQLLHIAMLPSSGMGHLTPFLRLAASLVGQNCRITFITTHPTVSLAESNLLSRFFSTYPQITIKEFHLLPLDDSLTSNSNNDPFYLQFEAISRSAHLLSSILSSSSPPLSAFISDISVASSFIPITSNLCIPNYILFTSSAKMLAFCAYYPKTLENPILREQEEDDYQITIPGLPSIHKSRIPLPLRNPKSLFATQFLENGKKLVESNGIIINTFEALEPDSLAALNSGKVVESLPRVIPIGPLPPLDFERSVKGSSTSTALTAWLDDQREGSVVLVSFGSRSAMSREQIKELGDGLVRSGCGFVWVVKEKKVDREEEGGVGIEEMVGEGFVKKTEGVGKVVKGWVDQEAVLSHRSVGGFVSHCGWNSVTEAALHGVRILAWPQLGDQRINAEVVVKSGWGVWEENWGWGEKAEVVKGEVIGRKIKEMMGDEALRVKAAQVREAARRAQEAGGCAKKGFKMLIDMWKKVNY